MKKKIGILGGMGPEATIYLYNLILQSTTAHQDQDHITTIIYSNPSIPDRTEAILGQGPSPLPAIIEGASILQQAGADFILIPCVTAHYFYEDIIKQISIPIIHLLEETLQYVCNYPGDLKKIGLIATTGTMKTMLFQQLFEKNEIQIITPGEIGQNQFMNAIYGEKGVKSGGKKNPKETLLKVLTELLQQNVDAVIAGCSEVPLVLQQNDMDVPFINPIQLMAKRAVIKAGYRPK
jgi:aspartate racemase